ncbi:MAG TPA: DUF6457 domain-containing protein [Sporichthyaceae bacterium]|nr:DUF6457 domain-containing protein [Sporichthyaceae bacterium]
MTITRDASLATATAQLPLHQWFEQTLQAAGVRSALPDSACDPEAMADVLELARRSADSVCRPASPLAAFVAGVALGQAGGDHDELKEIIRRIVRSMS